VARRLLAILLDSALLGLVAAVLLTAAIGPVAALTGGRAMVIGGGSMNPTIPLGSMVVVQPVDPQSLRAGDVATFHTPTGVAITHRIARVIERSDGTWFETNGDANAHPDPALWPASAVAGRVATSVPGLGYASWLLRHPVGWINVAALAGWLLVARRLVRASPTVPAGRKAGLEGAPGVLAT